MLRTLRSRVLKTLAFTALTTLAAGQAHAGFSQVNQATGRELNHAAILSSAYGGNFVGNGVNFSNGAVTAERLPDNNAGTAQTSFLASSGSSAGDDQRWADGVVSARALARFAGYEQTLGILDGDAGGTFHALFSVRGTGLNVSGSVDNLDLSGKTFRFARGGGGEMFSSAQADNFGIADQMVSYKLTGPNGLEKYLLFFEDLGASEASDWDYNDLAVEISILPSAVPLPPAAFGALAVLLSGGVWKGRRTLRALFA